eukprot:m.145229 g.145229  ORF g.145229 m.145229 type:complete len:434 (+) comp11620_c0_seq1:282-1583(+)
MMLATILALSAVGRGPVPRGATAQFQTCPAQKSCIAWSISEASAFVSGQAPRACNGEYCEFTVCATLDLGNAACRKSATSTVSHSCIKDSGLCNPFSNDFSDTTTVETADLANGHVQCQTGKAGETLQFLFKDGRGCDMDGDVSDSVVQGDVTYSCQPRAAATPSCTGNAPGKECVWSVVLPACTTPAPTHAPTVSPTLSPTNSPTVSPTQSPTLSPTTSSPTVSPTVSPTTFPPTDASCVCPPPPECPGAPAPAPGGPSGPSPPSSPTPPTVAPGPIQTCADQDPCVDVTIVRKSSSAVCTSGTCVYEVCATLNLDNPLCRKSASDTVSHTCEKADDTCNPASIFTSGSSTEVVGVATGDVQCQTVTGGTTVEFVFKDGAGCSEGGNSGVTFSSPRTSVTGITCTPSTARTCTGAGNVGRECIWSVPVPICA